MNILITGGDGFCGWPTTIELLSRGYTVVIGDNLSRRNSDTEFREKSITPISSIECRIQSAKEVFNNENLFFRKNRFFKKL